MPHKVAVMNLDGSEPRVLWQLNLQHADEIAVDVAGNRVFWTNAGMRTVSIGFTSDRSEFTVVKV